MLRVAGKLRPCGAFVPPKAVLWRSESRQWNGVREGDTTLIKFLCPNGHPLASPDSRVGKSGQCPRCQAQFVVPAPDQPPEVAARQLPTEHPESARRSPQASAASGSEKFVFLCPNGHKLVGSPSLRGRAGQCPHCNSRFLIPDPHAAPGDETDQDEPLAGLGDVDLPETGVDHIVWDTLGADASLEDDAADTWSREGGDELATAASARELSSTGTYHPKDLDRRAPCRPTRALPGGRQQVGCPVVFGGTVAARIRRLRGPQLMSRPVMNRQ